MIVDGNKHCPRCNQQLPITDFYKTRRKTGDGYSGYCKSCMAQKAREWQSANPDAVVAAWQRRGAKIKSGETVLTEEQKRAHLEKTYAWRLNNLDKARKTQRDAKQRAREKNLEEYRAKCAIQCSKRRCLTKGYPTDVTAEDWIQLLEVFDRVCPFCNGRPELFDLDHLIPIHLGGFNVVGNIVPICRPCNAQKSRMDPKKFAREVKVDLLAISKKARIRDSVYPICVDAYKL